MLFHKSNKTIKILSKHQHQIEFLPPYSPDLNPIEFKQAQAKSIRHKLRYDVFELFASYTISHYYTALATRKSADLLDEINIKLQENKKTIKAKSPSNIFRAASISNIFDQVYTGENEKKMYTR